MDTLTWLLVSLIVLLVGLGAVLVATWLRLSRELRQLGDRTESATLRVQNAVRTIQLAVPIVALLRQAGMSLVKKYRQNKKEQKGE